MKVDAANPGSDADSDCKSDDSSHYAQRSSFSCEEAVEQTLGRAQCFHDSEVTTPIEYPTHQCRKYAKSCRQNNQRARRKQGSASFVEHVSLGLHHLAYRLHIGGGEAL